MRNSSALKHYQPHLDKDLHACIIMFTYTFSLVHYTFGMHSATLLISW